MQVRIYRPAKTAMQSGRGKSKTWLVEPDLTTPRRPEPLMGWVSSGDTLGQLRMRFETLEAAKAFCERKGWRYTVHQPRERTVPPKNYGDNFRHVERE